MRNRWDGDDSTLNPETMVCRCCFWPSLGVAEAEVVGGGGGGGDSGTGGDVEAISLDLMLGRRLIVMMDSCLLIIPGACISFGWPRSCYR